MAYNLIRLLTVQATLLADQIPRQLSFKYAAQIRKSWQQCGGGIHGACIHTLLALLA